MFLYNLVGEYYYGKSRVDGVFRVFKKFNSEPNGYPRSLTPKPANAYRVTLDDGVVPKKNGKSQQITYNQKELAKLYEIHSRGKPALIYCDDIVAQFKPLKVGRPQTHPATKQDSQGSLQFILDQVNEEPKVVEPQVSSIRVTPDEQCQVTVFQPEKKKEVFYIVWVDQHKLEANTYYSEQEAINAATVSLNAPDGEHQQSTFHIVKAVRKVVSNVSVTSM